MKLMRIGLILVLLLPAYLYASPAEEPQEKDYFLLDSTQWMVGRSFGSLANRLDSFFANERADDEFGRSFIRVRQDYTVSESRLPSENRRYQINFRLPRLEEKLKLRYAQGKKEKRKSQMSPEERAEYARTRLDKERWLFNVDTGFTLAVPPRLTARARVRKNFYTGAWTNRFVEQLTYITDETGLRNEVNLQNDYVLTDDLLFRFTNLARWQILKKDFITQHGPSIIKELSSNQALSYNLVMSNKLVHGNLFYVTNYTFSINYRRNLYKNWLYGDVVPGIDFPKDLSFRRTPFIFFQLEFLFGG